MSAELKTNGEQPESNWCCAHESYRTSIINSLVEVQPRALF